jgi:hypothetical protein
MLTGGASQSDHGIGGDADESAGLSDSVALGQVVEDGLGGRFGESAAEQGRALAFGEAGAAGVAVEESELPRFAISAADREVAGVAFSEERAGGVLAAEAGEVVHGAKGPDGPGQKTVGK